MKQLTTTSSEIELACAINAAWPACSAPIVGTNANFFPGKRGSCAALCNSITSAPVQWYRAR